MRPRWPKQYCLQLFIFTLFTLARPQPKDSKQIFPLVLHLPSIGKVIRKHKHLIYDSPSLKKIFPVGSIILAFCRTKNTKEILSSKPCATLRADNQWGCFKCTAKCELCQYLLKESNCFTSTGTMYPIMQILNCKSKNVIYLVTCKKCKVQYGPGRPVIKAANNTTPYCMEPHQSNHQVLDCHEVPQNSNSHSHPPRMSLHSQTLLAQLAC